LTANGKVDRAALPSPWYEPEVSARQTLETRLAQIMGSLLEVDNFSRDDNFFHAGGNPVLGALVLGRVRQTFGVSLTAHQLFEAPTVSGFAAEIERARLYSSK
jgi:hypothetical protein